MGVVLLKPKAEVDPASLLPRLERLQAKPGDIVIVYINTLMNIGQRDLGPVLMSISRDTKCPVAVLPQGVSVEVVEKKVVDILRQQIERQYREEYERRKGVSPECQSTSTDVPTVDASTN